jgi:hypothetical protein
MGWQRLISIQHRSITSTMIPCCTRKKAAHPRDVTTGTVSPTGEHSGVVIAADNEELFHVNPIANDAADLLQQFVTSGSSRPLA